jgi:hypothetical protein
MNILEVILYPFDAYHLRGIQSHDTGMPRFKLIRRQYKLVSLFIASLIFKEGKGQALSINRTLCLSFPLLLSLHYYMLLYFSQATYENHFL